MEGRVVVITGAGGRLGQRMVRGFAEAGAVVAGLDRSPDRIAAHSRVHAYRADVTDEQVAKQVFQQVADELGAPAALVHTVGMWAGQPLLETSLGDWQEVVSVNLASAFLCAREAVRHMDGGGRLVFIASRQGADAGVGEQGAYSAAKAGVIRLAEAIADEFAEAGITTHVLAPSTILFEEADEAGVPAGDLVTLALNVCGPLGTAVNGATLRAYGTG